MQSVVAPTEDIKPIAAIPPVMVAAINDSRKNNDRIKKLLKDTRISEEGKPFEGTKEAGKTQMPKTQGIKKI